jgi:cyclopropane fatty-acyl-phospholipid synthase-like methyltransferase
MVRMRELTGFSDNRSSDDLKAKIRNHYDRASVLYRELWGLHIHHGYWIDGMETKDRAQEQLVELLAHKAAIYSGTTVLDVGCGIGGSAILLANRYRANVTGITISPVQAKMAMALAAMHGAIACGFVVMDAEHIAIREKFDVIWAVEALSHMKHRNSALCDVIALLKTDGRLAIADWFKRKSLTAHQEETYIRPIENSMLVPELHTMQHYIETIRTAGCRITAQEDLTTDVAKTWEICGKLLQTRVVWQLAQESGQDFVLFLRGFRAMRNALRCGAFQYGLIVAEKSA